MYADIDNHSVIQTVLRRTSGQGLVKVTLIHVNIFTLKARASGADFRQKSKYALSILARGMDLPRI